MSDAYFIHYPVVSRILEHLTEIIFDPPRSRPEGILLLSDPNNGKSCTLRKLASDVLARTHQTGQRPNHPVVIVQAPVAGVRRDFYSAMARALCIPEQPRATSINIRRRIIDVLAEAKTLALCVDELHHIMPAGWARARIILDDIKFISNELKLPVFLAGTAYSYSLISRDDQYLDRFPPAKLPRWNLDQDFVRLLRSIERHLEAPEGAFACRAHSELIWKHSLGRLGRIISICEKALQKSRYSSSRNITEVELNAAGFGDLPWIRNDEVRGKQCP